MHQEDTIAAIATARGEAALAIVRLSGAHAISVAASCFRGSDLASAEANTAHFGYVVDGEGNELDQVVATVFHAPRSATGEDTVEISCHGGDFAPQLVLQRLLDAGARMAQPGEFTQRSFLNGKIDLAQAEAVADLIHASSERAHQVSLSQLKGRYSERLSALREELLELCAFLELELDFSEEDVAFADRERLESLLSESEKLLTTLLESYDTGEKLRDGVRVVIGGRPNAGKSTLLNALVGRDRAIVSATPGTTRDEIEAEAQIDGVRYRFVDTAGLRETADAIEAEGVRRAEASIQEADVLLYVVDLTTGLDADEQQFLTDMTVQTRDMRPLIIGNKRDLVNQATVPAVDGVPSVTLSAEIAQSEADELDPVINHLTDVVAEGLSRAESSAVVMNRRHRQHLRGAVEAIHRAKTGLSSELSGDMLTLDIRTALDEIGAITGEITNEDVLDQIFSRFCIGK